ncbi:MAG: hypothetical protein EOL97_15590 [Spirochaetia bacterium]|nr:hypothetical protein [Spirochaetia bacterium]
MVAVSNSGLQGASMIIRTALDVAPLNRGLLEIKKKFSDLKSNGVSVGNTLKRIGVVSASLARTLGAVGIAGASAMIGIASKAPAVAPALASMQVTFEKITRTLGSSLRPVFDEMANSFSGFGVWVEENKDSINKWGIEALASVKKIVSGASDAWEGLRIASKPIEWVINLVDGSAEEGNKKGLLESLGPAVIAGLVTRNPVVAGAVYGLQTIGGFAKGIEEAGGFSEARQDPSKISENLPMGASQLFDVVGSATKYLTQGLFGMISSMVLMSNKDLQLGG